MVRHFRPGLSALTAAFLASSCTALFGPVPCESDDHCPDPLTCVDALCVEVGATDGGGERDAGRRPDGGSADGGVPSDSGPDAGPTDGGAQDGGPTDGGSTDGGGNQPPVATPDTLTLAEDTSGSINVLSNDSDPEGGTLTLQSVSQPSHGAVTFSGDGAVVYTPSANYFGDDSLTYQVVDDDAAASTGTLTIDVTAVDDPPTAPNVTWFVAIDSPLTDTLPGDDVDGDALTWERVPPNPTLGDVVVTGATGEATYTPTTGSGGVDAFGYRVSDGIQPSSPGTVTVIVLDKTWTGAVSNAWSDANNWSPVGVPAAADSVWIRADAATDPVLSANVSVAGILIDDGTFVELLGFNLTVTESFRSPPSAASWGITGTGSVVFAGTVRAARGAVHRLSVTGNATLDGTFVVEGDLVIPKDGVLRVANQTLDVRGTTSITYDSTDSGLLLQDPAGRALLHGDVTFDGENDAAAGTASMTAGEVWLYADLTTIDTANNPKTLSPNGTAFVFAGTATQTVTFERPLATYTRLDDVRVLAGADVQLNTTLVLAGRLEMEDGAQLTGARVEYAGALPATNTGYAVTTSAVVGDIVVGAASDVHGNVVVESGNRIDIGPWPVRFHEGLDVQMSAAADGLFLEDSAGTVTVDGAARFAGIASGAGNANRMTAGTLKLRGDLTQTYSSGTMTFTASGTRVVFDGDALQVVRFDSPASNGAHFAGVRFENPAGVRLATDAWAIGNVVVAAGASVEVAQSFSVQGGFSMEGEADVIGAGTLHMKSDVPNTALGYAIATHIDADVVLPGDRLFHGAELYIPTLGSLDVNGHRLELFGDFLQSTDDSSDGLLMDAAADQVIVHGDAVMRCDWSSGSTLGRFAAGTLRVGGDFKQISTSIETRVFAASGTKVVLDGTAEQTVSFDSGLGFNDSRFHHLRVENLMGVHMLSPVWVAGDLELVDGAKLTLENQLHVAATATWAGAGTVDGAGALYMHGSVPATPTGTAVPVRVAGAATLTDDVVVHAPVFGPVVNAELRLGGHTLEVVGDFQSTIDSSNDGLYMQAASDLLLVRGDMQFFGTYPSGNVTGHFTAGEIRVEGNFVQGSDWNSDRVFVSTGTEVVFAGTDVQQVSFIDPLESSFQNVRVLAGATVQTDSQLHLTGALTVGGLFRVKAATLTDVDGDLTVESGGELDNAGTVYYSGTYTLDGTLTGNAPVLQ